GVSGETRVSGVVSGVHCFAAVSAYLRESPDDVNHGSVSPAVSEVGPRIPAERCRDGNLRPFVGWAYLREEPLSRLAGRKMGRGYTATNRARTQNRTVARVLSGAPAGIERPGRA